MTPIVAVVGRPNVGKSTLFNRLVGQKLAIVHDSPGVTRDRHYAEALLYGREIIVIDTGGFDPTTDDPMGQGIARHVRAAIAEADVVVCVLDGRQASTVADSEAVKLLRKSHKPVVFVANKVDGLSHEIDATELYSLGVGDLLTVSALHGRGFGELELAVSRALPAATEEGPATSDEDLPRVALLGRPNAGKSSLFNRLAKSERSLVDDRPGTTRDPIDSVVKVGGRTFLLVDTAGVRRPSKVKEEVETASVIRAIRNIARAHVVVLMCDATAGMAEQDQRLLGLCVDRGRAIIVGLNKMDLLDAEGKKKALAQAEEQLHFARWAKVVPLSAKTGKGVRPLVDQLLQTVEEFDRRVPTAELNRFFEGVLERRPPPTSGGKAPRLYYVTQAHIRPPTFVAKSNAPDAITAAYKRFVQNQIRKTFGFESVPIRMHFRKR